MSRQHETHLQVSRRHAAEEEARKAIEDASNAGGVCICVVMWQLIRLLIKITDEKNEIEITVENAVPLMLLADVLGQEILKVCWLFTFVLVCF